MAAKKRHPPEPLPSFFTRDGEWKRFGGLAQVERREFVPRPRFKWGKQRLGLPPQRAKPKE
jgi:hypothetical protein